jgi:hypothetical protein
MSTDRAQPQPHSQQAEEERDEMVGTAAPFVVPPVMKAAILMAFGDTVEIVEDLPTPAPGYGEVLIQIVTSGLCHTGALPARNYIYIHMYTFTHFPIHAHRNIHDSKM